MLCVFRIGRVSLSKVELSALFNMIQYPVSKGRLSWAVTNEASCVISCMRVSVGADKRSKHHG